MSGKRLPSGFGQIPPVFTKPLWSDTFFWLIVVMLVLWGTAIRYFFL